MKKIVAIIISVVFSLAATAQPSGKDHKGFNRQIESEKIAFYTQAMDLTPEEAQAFWPVYNAIEKDQKALEKAVWESFRELNISISEAKGDREIEKALDKYLKANEANVNLHAKSLDKYKAILPPAKVAKFFTAQENFRRHMFKNVRGGENKPHNKK